MPRRPGKHDGGHATADAGYVLDDGHARASAVASRALVATEHAREGAPLGCWRQRGAHAQAIGSSRGGRNTKVNAITDRYGRPLAFLTPGQAANCRAAEHGPVDLPKRCIVHADGAYDTNRVRDLIEIQAAVPNILPKRTRLWESCFGKTLYKGRNAIERMFYRLKDCRRLATRFLGSIYLAAAIARWL